MPIYEYRCSSCGFQKEYLRKVRDPVLTVCPKCSKRTFSKMLTAAGFRLKGSGWYATDFKNSRSAEKSGGEGKSDVKTESKTESKSEGKSKGKGESKRGGSTETKSEAAGCGAGACPAGS